MPKLIINGIKPLEEKEKQSFAASDDDTITEIIQPTELGESLKELNNDQITKDSRMSGIDMRSRLFGSEITGILAVDTLVSFRFLPQSCLGFTRQKKRLAVSIEGKGRDDIVNIVAGKREHDVQAGGGSFIDRLTGKFKQQSQQN